ncbi:sugar O-acyltransferase, sialic acid O-acetyltransferase NeuD family [Micromonospora phaseoli]|uniref:Sugar O-acyltransferase, sialic acid O-acetyltransferase NeuD family n=1 Tax=Micromonospora phaseoli TaxID=1144548 RepID=A0A1H6T4S4_9ACTN|nr:acetyltransferase [Micromonospora phaseoli]PZW04206.1 sugar O-acyltransferase (sialic acid O-acetyltransferase NeuD family) [Micromonospora phaseoli]GIJ79394.1 transferase [Micromonospora phaseoli]SEI74266.1 sugar O-acyltransferase, sialic acid O-acetyltransferase NeuD family [Micromonospora phaseoli]
MRELVIVGAGGFARETAAAVRAINDVRPTWRLRGFLDDDPALRGTERAGLPILGAIDRLADLPDAAVVVCVGNPRDYAARQRIVHRLGLPAERYPTIVHPAAHVGAGSSLGPGTVLLAGVVLTADVTVGAHVAVMPQVVLTHDDRVADHVTLASGVRLGGGVALRTGAYLGAAALIRESVTVGEWSLVGMGSVVLRDVPSGEVWLGSPARRLRAARPGRLAPQAEPAVASQAAPAVGELTVSRVVGN